MKELLKNLSQDLEQVKLDIKNNNYKKQIPNLLTASRIISPLVIIPIALTGNIALCGLVTGLFATTDLFDGYLARKFNATSNLGKILDAVSDKIFATTAIIPLILTNPLFLINTLGEIGIGLYNSYSQVKGYTQNSTMTGKIKSASLYTTIVAGYLSPVLNLPSLLAPALVLATGIMQFKTLETYRDNYEKFIDNKTSDEKPVVINETINEKEDVKKYYKKPLSYSKDMDKNKVLVKKMNNPK